MLLLSLDCFILPLIRTLYCRVLSKVASSTFFFESLIWLDLKLNPGLQGHWLTLKPLCQFFVFLRIINYLPTAVRIIIIIIIIIIIFIERFLHQLTLMVLHLSLSERKSPQVSRTQPSILAHLNNAVLWIVSTLSSYFHVV